MHLYLYNSKRPLIIIDIVDIFIEVTKNSTVLVLKESVVFYFIFLDPRIATYVLIREIPCV